MVTLYYHFISRILSKYNGDLDEMVNAFVEDRIVYGPYFDHLASYWKIRHEPNVFIVSFEQLSEVRTYGAAGAGSTFEILLFVKTLF